MNELIDDLEKIPGTMVLLPVPGTSGRKNTMVRIPLAKLETYIATNYNLKSESVLKSGVLEARLEQMDSHIGRLEVLRAWAVNHQPVFDSGERMATFTIAEIDNEIKIVKKWQDELRHQITRALGFKEEK